MEASRRRIALRLTEKEAVRLAEVLEAFPAPRNLIILEAIQAGLRTIDPRTIPGRRRKVVYFRLPHEMREELRQVAAQSHISQQSLIRHMLFTYLAKPPWNEQPAPKPRILARTDNGMSR